MILMYDLYLHQFIVITLIVNLHINLQYNVKDVMETCNFIPQHHDHLFIHLYSLIHSLNHQLIVIVIIVPQLIIVLIKNFIMSI